LADIIASTGSFRPTEARVQSVTKAAAILYEVARSENGLSGVEVSNRTGLPRQATYHLLQSLSAVGLLARNERGRYIMGIQVGILAEGFRRHLSPPEYLSPLVRRFASLTGESCNAVGWRDGEPVALVRVTTGSNAVQAMGAPLGLYESPHARAGGKMLLALADEELRRSVLSARPLGRETANTITRRKALETALEEARRQGYAVDREEYRLGVGSLAVPVGHELALVLTAPIDRFNAQFDQYLATALDIAKSSPRAED
jgi:DNA-binding IclR family transcriptional regulator